MLELAFAPTAAVALVAGLAVELRLFAPGRVPGRREAIVWSAGWLLLALAVAVGIALAGGPAGEWTTVYLIERSLARQRVSAHAFALLGLGSLLALVEILLRALPLLDETIAVILAFVGIKILAADVVQISDLASLAVVAALLAGGIVASLVADRLAPPQATEEATRRPPRCPRELSPPAPSARRSISNKAAPRTKT